MTLVMTTPPAVAAVSLAEAKAHLRITHNDDDAYVQRLIAAAERVIEQRCSLRLILQTWSLFIDQWPDDGEVSLQMSPVSLLDDIIIYSEDDLPAVMDLAHVYLDGLAKPARVVLRSGRISPQAGRKVNGIELRFIAGFGALATNVPEDLRQAVLLTVAHWFDHRGEAEGGAVPLAAIEIIKSYRLVRLT